MKASLPSLSAARPDVAEIELTVHRHHQQPPASCVVPTYMPVVHGGAAIIDEPDRVDAVTIPLAPVSMHDPRMHDEIPIPTPDAPRRDGTRKKERSGCWVAPVLPERPRSAPIPPRQHHHRREGSGHQTPATRKPGLYRSTSATWKHSISELFRPPHMKWYIYAAWITQLAAAIELCILPQRVFSVDAPIAAGALVACVALSPSLTMYAWTMDVETTPPRTRAPRMRRVLVLWSTTLVPLCAPVLCDLAMRLEANLPLWMNLRYTNAFGVLGVVSYAAELATVVAITMTTRTHTDAPMIRKTQLKQYNAVGFRCSAYVAMAVLLRYEDIWDPYVATGMGVVVAVHYMQCAVLLAFLWSEGCTDQCNVNHATTVYNVSVVAGILSCAGAIVLLYGGARDMLGGGGGIAVSSSSSPHHSVRPADHTLFTLVWWPAWYCASIMIPALLAIVDRSHLINDPAGVGVHSAA